MTTQHEAYQKWRNDFESDYDQKPSYFQVWQAATAEANKRIEALEGEVAELKYQLSILKPHPLCDTSCLLSCSMEADYAEKQYLKNQQLKANNHDLREALNNVLSTTGATDNRGAGARAEAFKALSATPAESLQEHDNEVIERCAKVLEQMELIGGLDFAEAIRALKVSND